MCKACAKRALFQHALVSLLMWVIIDLVVSIIIAWLKELFLCLEGDLSLFLCGVVCRRLDVCHHLLLPGNVACRMLA